MPKNIVLYSAKMCSDCQKLKAYMEEHGIEFEVRDIREHPEYGQEVQEKTGKLGVPYLVIDGEWIRGYDTENPFSDEFARGLFED